MSDEYRRALDAAAREYERALADRAALEDRIAQLRQTIGTLTKLCGFTPTASFGLADACRMVLRNAQEPMTPTAIRDRLASVGVDLDRYANPLAAIHTTLKRLAEAGELGVQDADESSRLAYEFLPRGLYPPATPGRPARARTRASKRS